MALMFHNLGYTLFLLAFYGAGQLLSFSVPLAILAWAVLLLGVSFYTAYVSCRTFTWSEVRSLEEGEIKAFMKRAVGHTFLFFGYLVLMVLGVAVIVPFYFMAAGETGNTLWFILGAVFAWFMLFLFMAFMYYWALAIQFPEDKPSQTLKRSFAFLLSGIGFSFFLLIYSIVNIVLSVVFVTLFPSVVGLSEAYASAVRLQYLKFKFREENPSAPKNDVSYLKDEEEKLGKRTLKSMIFPWKE